MKTVKFREIKAEIRSVGVDDGSFEPHAEGETWLVGAVLRGGEWIDGVLTDRIEIDGTDVTPTLIGMINESRHKDQLRVIMTSGITFAGFNVLDINEVFERTDLPVIVVSRKDPDLPAVKSALKNFSDWRERWEVLRSAGEITPFESEGLENRGATLYIQTVGISRSDAQEIIRMTATRGSIPEPLRAAHLIATGISRGESVGGV